jgi:hypothetical protein
MTRRNILITIITSFFLILSIAATFYNTLILQDFELRGVVIEFPTEESTYLWFIYDNKEYEMELESTELNIILLTVSNEVGVPVAELDELFVEYLKNSHEEALLL